MKRFRVALAAMMLLVTPCANAEGLRRYALNDRFSVGIRLTPAVSKGRLIMSHKWISKPQKVAVFLTLGYKF